MKLALAVTVAGVDVPAIVQAQRKHALAALQDYTRVKGRLDPGELAASLVLESMIFQCEAEIRWLDHVEARVLRHARESSTSPTKRNEKTADRDPAEPAAATTEGKNR